MLPADPQLAQALWQRGWQGHPGIGRAEVSIPRSQMDVLCYVCKHVAEGSGYDLSDELRDRGGR